MLRLSCLVLVLTLGVPAAGAWAQAPTRVALVPLDDRPVCLQYPEMMAPLAHAEVVAPPRPALGRFTTPGDPHAIGRWLSALDLSSIDALIVSVDMLAYGGLVASRVYEVDVDAALARLDVLREIRRRRPDLPIYGFSVIMRLAPTADGVNEAWRSKLSRWADISPYASEDPAVAAEVSTLERAIPGDALTGYTAARARNLRVNQAGLDLLADGVFTHLVLSQDDAKPRGVHVADRESLTRTIRERSLTDRAVLQPGADEVAMLLLARAVLAHHRISPSLHAIYSTGTARTMVAPFEDRPLHETVSFHIRTAGAVEADTPAADLSVFVFASRHAAGVPEAFAGAVDLAVRAGRRVVVADVDPKGDVQGASVPFTEALLTRDLPPRLYGYASWNTAGNTIGTAIPHGLLHHAGMVLASRCRSQAWGQTAEAQVRFMLHRLVNDYAYQGVVRAAVNETLRRQGRSSLWLGAHAEAVEADIRSRLTVPFERLAATFTRGRLRLGEADQAPLDVRVTKVGPLSVHLPWARTFEALIDVGVEVDVRDMQPGRPACEAASR